MTSLGAKRGGRMDENWKRDYPDEPLKDNPVKCGRPEDGERQYSEAFLDRENLPNDPGGYPHGEHPQEEYRARPQGELEVYPQGEARDWLEGEAREISPDESGESDSVSKPNKSKNTGLVAVGLAVLALLSKGKGIIVLLLSKLKFIVTFLKLGKFVSTAVSMLATIWVYALFYGIWFAVGLVALLFVHEFGHYYMSKRVGLKVSGPVFIPFVGAFIGMKEEPKDAIMEAKVGYAGPLFGSAAAVLALIIFWATGSTFAAVMANIGFILNLFNLMPVHPLDGGRVVSAISPYLWFIGIPILVYFTLTTFSPILLLILLLGIYQAYSLWKNRKERGPYYDVPLAERIGFAVIYFGLVIILGLGVNFTLNVLS